MSNSYRKLFAIPGAIGFSAAAFIGRLPAGMLSLAIILAISKLTGSYTVAGSVMAFAMIGAALAAPFSGRLVDRYGQYLILLVFSALHFVGASALITCAYFGAPLPALYMTAAIAGASRLPTGTMARTRWAYVTHKFDTAKRQGMLQAAYAFESVIDEVVFIFGPLLATFLCTAVNALAGLICCLIAYVGGAVSLALQKKTQPTVKPTKEKQSSAFRLPSFQVVSLSILFIGISAGAVEVLVVARADEMGSRPFAGGLMAILALSSIVAGFWYGKQSFVLSLQKRWIYCIGLLTLALIPFTFASNFLLLAVSLFVAGLMIAPTSIAGQILTERLLPAELLNEGMNIVVTAMMLGMAVGGWLAGLFVDKLGAYYAGILPTIAVLAAFIVALFINQCKTTVVDLKKYYNQDTSH